MVAAGNEVTFIARGAHLAAMHDRGLRIISPLGDIDLPKVVVVESSAALRSIDFAAAMRQPSGGIRENRQTRAFLLDVMREVVGIGQARGVALPQDYAEDRLAFCDTLPASMTASMYHDLQNGNRLELPWLSGGVVEYAQRIDFPCLATGPCGYSRTACEWNSGTLTVSRAAFEFELDSIQMPGPPGNRSAHQQLQIKARVQPLAEAHRQLEDTIICR